MKLTISIKRGIYYNIQSANIKRTIKWLNTNEKSSTKYLYY